MRVQFGAFTLDSESRELSRGQERIHLAPKAFDLLATLVRNRPRAMSKAELHEYLWPNTFVVETNLAVLIGDVRVALDDEARTPRFVRTVHGFGYAFIGSVTDVREPWPLVAGAGHWLVWGNREVRLGAGETVLGRDPDATVALNFPSVSRHHARIVISSTEITLEDLGSKNGTFLSGDRIITPVTLSDGDRIRVGSVDLIFRVQAPAGSTETVS